MVTRRCTKAYNQRIVFLLFLIQSLSISQQVDGDMRDTYMQMQTYEHEFFIDFSS